MTLGIYLKVSGIEKSPPTPEIPRNCGRSSIASNERFVSSHPRRLTSLQRRCQDSSRTRSGQLRDDTSTADDPTFTKLTDASFTAFQPCSTEEVPKFLIRFPPKSYSLDPLSTFILWEFLDELLPSICTKCNVSLQNGLLPKSQKAAIVTQSSRNMTLIQTMCRVIVQFLTWHSSPRSSNGLLLRTADGIPSDEQAPSWPPISLQTGAFHVDWLLFLRSSQIFWTQLTRLRRRCSDC